MLTQTRPQQSPNPYQQVPINPNISTTQTGIAAAGSSGGTLTSIDPSVLMAQWAAMQSQNLPTQATIGQSNVNNYQHYQPQQSQQYGQLTDAQMGAIAEYIQISQVAADRAARYINFLESAVLEYFKLAEFSTKQDNLINKFLYDREFALEYIRGAWIQAPFDREFASRIADVYLEFDAYFPKKQDRNPEFTGSPVNYAAQIVSNNGNPQVVPPVIPPLPNSGNTSVGAITPQQYFQAINEGQVVAAKAAALRDPTALFAAIFEP
jgi:hypothetical protein